MPQLDLSHWKLPLFFRFLEFLVLNIGSQVKYLWHQHVIFDACFHLSLLMTYSLNQVIKSKIPNSPKLILLFVLYIFCCLLPLLCSYTLSLCQPKLPRTSSMTTAYHIRLGLLYFFHDVSDVGNNVLFNSKALGNII